MAFAEGAFSVLFGHSASEGAEGAEVWMFLGFGGVEE